MIARWQWAARLYEIGGWDVFRSDAREYRKWLRARRRRPSWADEP